MYDTMMVDNIVPVKHLTECFKRIDCFKNSVAEIDEFRHIHGVDVKFSIEDDIPFVEYKLPFVRESWDCLQNLSSLHITDAESGYAAKSDNFSLVPNRSVLGKMESENLTGRINFHSLVDANFDEATTAFYRYLIPIDSVDWLSDIHTASATLGKSWTLGLIEFSYGDVLLHVFPCSRGERKFMVVESLTEVSYTDMESYVYSISLTIGFITGTIHLGKCYIFRSKTTEYDGQLSIKYCSMRSSSSSHFRIFTTNMYYVSEMLKSNKVEGFDRRLPYDEYGNLQPYLQDWLQQDFLQSLFHLIHKDPKISRAVSTLIESADFPLEYQASVRAVVLETLAHSTSGPKLISDNCLWDDIMNALHEVLDRYLYDTARNLKISDKNRDILRGKISNMNSPTNADSLAKPFEDVGYILTENDKKTLKTRNQFLHGSLVKGNIEEQAKELFYLSLSFHKLSCIIILKRAGFSGYILNNPVLFNCPKAVNSGESPLLKI